MRMLKCAFFLLLVSCHSGCATNVYPVYLTWQRDPSTTMTVNFHTPQAPHEAAVYYDTQARDGNPAKYRFRAQGETRQMPGLKDGRYLNHIELSGLTPDTTYYFVAGDSANGYRKEQRFHTIPDDHAPLRFIVGGDMSVLPREKLLLQQAAKVKPMFVVIGGDIAYDNGDPDDFYITDLWLKRWSQILRGEDDTLVPMVLAIGNHEVNDLDESHPQEERAPYYFNYFPQGGKSYFARQFGADVLLIALDSGHINDHASQADWLEKTLAAAAQPYTMTVYHVPLYPSVREEDYALTAAGRLHWLPIFDRHELFASFEHHDHAFKRSKLLRGGKEAEGGTLYLGDGAFGVKRRQPAKPLPEYLEKASATPHFWVVETSQEGVRFHALDTWGHTVDEVRLPRPAQKSSAR